MAHIGKNQQCQIVPLGDTDKMWEESSSLIKDGESTRLLISQRNFSDMEDKRYLVKWFGDDTLHT